MDARYRWLVLALLTLAYVVNFVDRQLLVILQEPIKRDLALTDTQLGLISGFMFAVFYITLGIPIARWADRGNRRNIISLAIVVWSVMTALCGMATNFLQLALARIGVGVGEAGCSPPSHSLISDYFPARSRPLAMAIYASGIYLGIMAGFFLGGLIHAHFGWRMAFVVVGLPGLVLALVLRLVVREPARGQFDGGHVSSNELGFLSVLRQFWRIASFRYIALGCALTSFTSYGVNNWLPSYMIRAHQMSVTEVGLVFAFLVGGGGFLGAVLGGAVCNRLVARDVRWYLWLPTVLVVSAAPIALMSFTAESKMTAVALYIWPIVAGAVFLGPAIAVCHALVAPQFRAQISAVLFFVVNLVGLGLGPLVTGMVSDLLSPTVGPVVALRYGLIAVTLIGGGSVVFFLRAARTLQADLQVQLSCENQRPI